MSKTNTCTKISKAKLLFYYLHAEERNESSLFYLDPRLCFHASTQLRTYISVCNHVYLTT